MNALLLVLLWGLVAGWITSLRRGPRQRALWVLFLSFALVKTLGLQTLAMPINDALGPHTNILLQHLLGIATAVALLRFISLITGAYERRPKAKALQLFLGVGVAAVLVVLFAFTHQGITGNADELLAKPITQPTAVAYWLLLEAYLGTALVMGGLLTWRVSRATPTNLLRVGLWLMTAGVGLNAVYAVYRSVYIVLHALAVELPTGVVVAVSNTMLPVSNLLVVAGVAMPAWLTARHLVTAVRSLRALGPLWETMRTTFPDVILYVSSKLPTADGILATARLRLYRRLIEIRDGMLLLRGYVSDSVTAEALGFLAEHAIRGEEAAVLAEACWIEVALRRVRAGEQPKGNPSGGGSVPGGENETEEASWLARVSRAHARSPYPAQFADRVSPTSSSRSPAPTPSGSSG